MLAVPSLKPKRLRGVACAVEVDVSLGPPSLSLRAECPEEGWVVAGQDCEAQRAVLVDAVLTAERLDGEVATLLRHRGDGCGEDQPAEGPSVVEATMTAERLAD